MAQSNTAHHNIHEYEIELWCSNCLQTIAVKHGIIEHGTYDRDEAAARERLQTHWPSDHPDHMVRVVTCVRTLHDDA